MTTHADLTRRIDAHLRRAATRIRTRRLVVTLSAAGLGVALVGAIAASYEALQLLAGGEGDAGTITEPARIWIVVVVLVACVIAWTRGVSRVALARDVDRRLGLADRTATAIALAGGAVASPLGDRVLADTTASLDAAGVDLDRAFPARPRGAVLHTLRAGSVLVAIWVAIVLASRLIGSEGGGSDSPFLPGEAPRAVDTADAPPPEPDGLGPDTPPPEEVPDEPDTPDEPDEPDVIPPDEPEAEPEPPPPPAGPQATAELVLSSEEFDPGDDVLALGVARPGAGLTAPAGFTLSVEIDGKVLGTGDAVALLPAEERGTLTPLRLGRLAGAAELLRPGEHEAVLLLEPEGGGAVVRSEPQRFRIRGDQDGDSPQGQPPPPPPEPESDPSAPPPPEPPPAEAENGGGEEDPPEEAEAPALPEQTERKVVVPLFREGEEIEKTGPRLVLVPGGGPESPPQSVPLADALDEARRRAETAVDRAGVRAEDRDLVRRYFERLRRLADPPR